jgi:hypothetical protein
MNSSRRDFLLRSGLVSLGGTGLLLSACGGGGGTGGGGTVQLSQDVNGRVVIEAWVQLPTADIERIKREYMAEVVSRGLGINEEKSCLTMPPRPYSGVWVRLGKTTVMTDEEGRFTLPAGSTGSVVEVLRQPTSKEVELAERADSYDPNNLTITVAYLHQGGKAMVESNRSVDTSCHTPSSSRSRAETRCKSWDGGILWYSGSPDTPQDSPQGLAAYVGSTCWKFVESGECANEGNVIKNVRNMVSGPSCKPNHGWRYCQEMTGELEVSIPDAIKVGETGTVRVTNRTTGIVSELSVSDGAVFVPGQRPFVEVSALGSYAWLDHSNSLEKKYYETRTIQLKPKLPSGVSGKVVTVRVEVGGKRYSKKVNVGKFDAPYLAQYIKDMCDINGQYRMGRTEVTVAMWKEYCEAIKQDMPLSPGWGWIDNHPMVNVGWYDIMGTDGNGGYCAWASSVSGVNLSLPTESQWVFAATGGDGRNYPWGGYGPSNDGGTTYPGWDSSKCVNYVRGDRPTAPVGSLPAGNSPFGCSDMAGNVWEWCLDADTDYPKSKVLKGGSGLNNLPVDFRCANRSRGNPDLSFIDSGFRLSAGPK